MMVCPGSEIRVKGRSNFARNFWWLRGSSGLTPTTSYPSFFQLGEIIAQVAGLDGTGGRIVFGVKIKHQLLPLELRQRHLVAILVPSRERRGLIAFL